MMKKPALTPQQLENLEKIFEPQFKAKTPIDQVCNCILILASMVIAQVLEDCRER